MVPVYEPGRFANWISPPAHGVKGTPIEYEYVKFNAAGGDAE
jgi:benzoyl-CoA 2,3-dioxygenase component B